MFACIFFGTSAQQCEPKKMSVRKTQKPKRFLGFVLFQGGIQKIPFPTNDLWGGLEQYVKAILGGKIDHYMI